MWGLSGMKPPRRGGWMQGVGRDSGDRAPRGEAELYRVVQEKRNHGSDAMRFGAV